MRKIKSVIAKGVPVIRPDVPVIIEASMASTPKITIVATGTAHPPQMRNERSAAGLRRLNWITHTPATAYIMDSRTAPTRINIWNFPVIKTMTAITAEMMVSATTDMYGTAWEILIREN